MNDHNVWSFSCLVSTARMTPLSNIVITSPFLRWLPATFNIIYKAFLAQHLTCLLLGCSPDTPGLFGSVRFARLSLVWASPHCLLRLQTLSLTPCPIYLVATLLQIIPSKIIPFSALFQYFGLSYLPFFIRLPRILCPFMIKTLTLYH